MCPYLPLYIHFYSYLLIFILIYPFISIDIHSYPYLFTSIHLRLPLSTDIHFYQLISLAIPCIYFYPLISIFIQSIYPLLSNYRHTIPLLQTLARFDQNLQCLQTEYLCLQANIFAANHE
jgi:hypothetical protein